MVTGVICIMVWLSRFPKKDSTSRILREDFKCLPYPTIVGVGYTTHKDREFTGPGEVSPKVGEVGNVHAEGFAEVYFQVGRIGLTDKVKEVHFRSFLFAWWVNLPYRIP